MKLSDRLFEEGVFAQGIAFPTVARDKARVRTIVTATHTRDELQFALDVFAQGRPRARHHLSRRRHAPDRLHATFFDTYTQDLTAEDLQRLFTRDTREAYRFFARGVDADALQAPAVAQAHGRAGAAAFIAFTMKLSPARRVVYGVALAAGAASASLNLFRGFGIIEFAPLPFGIDVGVAGPLFRQGTWSLLIAFVLMNLLVLLEVADRLSLKNDLEIAREIQQAMLPSGALQRARRRDVRHDPAGQHRRRRLLRHPAARRRTARDRASATSPAKAARRRC